MTDTNRTQITGRVDDSLRDRIAAVQSKHQPQARGNSCLCGWVYHPAVDDSHFDHVADTVIAEIGLKKDSWKALDDFYNVIPMHRYVTEWVCEVNDGG